MITRIEFTFQLIFVLAFLTLNTFCALSQPNLDDFSLRRSFKQNDKHVVFFIRDEDKRELRSFKQDVWYHWFKSQQILSTQGGSGGTLLEGEYLAYFYNKQLAEKGSFRRGVKNGEWLYWNSLGFLIHKERWNNGRLVKSESYDELGQIQSEKRIRGNKLIQKEHDTLSIFKKGILVERVSYNRFGDIISVQHFRNGKLHGKSVTFNEDREVSKSKYKNGNLIEPKEKNTEVENDVEKEKVKFIQSLKNIFKKKEGKSKRNKKLDEV